MIKLADKVALFRDSPKIHKVVGDVAEPSVALYEGFKSGYRRGNSFVVGGGLLKNSNIDISWLPGAAKTYNVSADPNDYVLVDVPIVTVDIPNRNMQGFPMEEISYFDPMYGRFVYQTFIAKPSCLEHDNMDPLKARGVIFDAAIDYVKPYNVYKIRILQGFDRTKDRDLVRDIINKKRTGYSMGSLVSAFMCTGCGAIDTNNKPCACMDVNRGNGKGSIWHRVLNKRVMPGSYTEADLDDVFLIWQACLSSCFIESSSVGQPADSSADTQSIYDPMWFS